jgi:uncharacterized protein YdeI (YjbR/CyaY-like superfamily)
MPCYCFQGNNVVLIGSFKEFCINLVFKELPQHSNGILVKPEKHTPMRFLNLLIRKKSTKINHNQSLYL